MAGMVTKKITMTPNDVKHFVSVTSKCEFDIDISNRSFAVDAKSIVGVLGLDFSSPLYVSYSGYNEELETLLHALSCAC